MNGYLIVAIMFVLLSIFLTCFYIDSLSFMDLDSELLTIKIFPIIGLIGIIMLWAVNIYGLLYGIFGE